ncbi:MAG: hypothetical protein RR942_17825 [Romboutsia sp.]
MGQLYNWIKDFRNGDVDTFLLILEKFELQLNKLQRNSSYEDMKCDLTLFLFDVLNKIPFEKECFKEENCIRDRSDSYFSNIIFDDIIKDLNRN